MNAKKLNHIIEVACGSLSKRYSLTMSDAREFIYRAMPNILKALRKGVVTEDAAIYKYIYTSGKNERIRSHREKMRSAVVYSSDILEEKELVLENDYIRTKIKEEEDEERRRVIDTALSMLQGYHRKVMENVLNNPADDAYYAVKDLGYKSSISYSVRKSEAMSLMRINVRKILSGEVQKKSSKKNLLQGLNRKEGKRLPKLDQKFGALNVLMGIDRSRQPISLNFLTSLTQNSRN